MVRHIKYSSAERRLAARTRELAAHRDVLYHGTRYTRSILKTGVLFHSLTGGDPKVCLTRSAEVAAYSAGIDRDADEGRGSVFIFDRRSLQRRYKVEANLEVYWHSETTFHDEAEEEIWDDIINVGDHLIGVVSDPTIQCLPKRRKLIFTSRRELKRRRRTEIEARLIKLVIPRNATKLTRISKPTIDQRVTRSHARTGPRLVVQNGEKHTRSPRRRRTVGCRNTVVRRRASFCDTLPPTWTRE